MNADVRLLSKAQADALQNQFFAIDERYNPMLDGLGRWIVSEQEVEQTTNPDFLWIKTLPVIEFIAPKVEMQ